MSAHVKEKHQKKHRFPSYRLHKQSGQAVVTLSDGAYCRRDILLGKYDTPESRTAYDRIILEWEANGRRLAPSKAATPDISINELILAFWKHAEVYYRNADGEPTSELESYKYTLRPLKQLYGQSQASAFSPMALKAVRQQMIDAGLARGNINMRIGRIKRMFAWGAENEIVQPAVYHGLLAVKGLKRGRSEAKETAPIQPVPRAIVDATLPHLPPTIADMVRVQLETGMRPGELVIMRACDIDMSGKVWLYEPRRHKTEHHGYSRVIPIGPKAQLIIRRYLKTDIQAYLFSPIDAVEEHHRRRREQRQTKLTPSQAGRKRKRAPKRAARPVYDTHTYARAIARGCDIAFPPPKHLARRQDETKTHWLSRLSSDELDELKAWRKQHRWHPHRLRHTRALELKRECGLDVARAVLGHRSPVITEHYAALDLESAVTAMTKLG